MNALLINPGNQNINDDSILYFNSLDELMKEIERREFFTDRERVETSNIKFLTNSEVQNAERRIYMTDGKKLIPVADTSWTSLKNRILVYGVGLTELPNQILKDVLNDRIKSISSVNVVSVDGMVRAILSKNYKVLPIKEVLEKALVMLQNRFGNIEFVGGEVSYDYTRIKLLFPDHAEEIQDLYGQPTTYVPGVLVQSSDTGYSAISVYPLWSSKGTTMVLGNPDENLRMEHKGNASMDGLEEGMNFLFLKFKDTAALIQEQMKEKLDFPSRVIEKIAKKVNLGLKKEKQMQDRLEIWTYTHPDQPVTSHDITTLFMIAANEAVEDQKNKMEIIAGKVMMMRLKKMDNLNDD